MKKKSTRKTSARRPVRKTGKKGHYVEFFGLGIGMLIGVFAIAGFHTADKPMVLGTKVFLASDGSESAQWAGRAPESEYIQKDYTQELQMKEELLRKKQELQKQEMQKKQELLRKKQEQYNTWQAQQKMQNSGSGKQKIPAGTIVDCVSPEGQHVRQSFEACAALNKASNQDNFSFTILKNNENEHKQKMPPPEVVKPSGAVPETVDRQKGKGQGSPEERLPGPKFGESKSGPQGQTEVGQDNLEEINGKFEEKRIRFERNETNGVFMQKNNVRANTSFPVSVDPETNQLFITTPSGKKEVTVLPDAAVERILQNRILSSVETQASTSAVNGNDATTQTTLTELNNKPVFKVKGFSNKKVLGLFPASFAKTVYVSAEDGSVVKTDETFFSKMLETVSF